MLFSSPVWSAAIAASPNSGLGSSRPLTMPLLRILSQSVWVIATGVPESTAPKRETCSRAKFALEITCCIRVVGACLSPTVSK